MQVGVGLPAVDDQPVSDRSRHIEVRSPSIRVEQLCVDAEALSSY